MIFDTQISNITGLSICQQRSSLNKLLFTAYMVFKVPDYIVLLIID